VFATRPSTEWEQVLVDADVPSSPVRSIGEVLDDPQVEFLGLFEREIGPVPYIRAPWIFDGERPPIDAHIPRLGEHTVAVLGAVMTPGEVDALRAAGVVQTAEDYEASSPPASDVR
jgi:crotonobetainyl-CoA:carnitine CoA-transferase CaiB-like acyl-CoA transferase